MYGRFVIFGHNWHTIGRFDKMGDALRLAGGNRVWDSVAGIFIL